MIVLGNLMSKDGVLNDESSSRMDLAIAAYKQGKAKNIITCGWGYREDSELPIAEAMKNYAVDKGVVEEAIIVEVNSRDTVGDAVFTLKNWIAAKKIDSILVCTSDYHVNRTRKIFEFIYGKQYFIEVIGAETKDVNQKVDAEISSINAFNKTFEGVSSGDMPAVFECLIKKHPFYNGDIYPEIA